MLLQISNLYAEGISKLRRDSNWKDAKPAFTCDLWHSRCMKEYFTMTAHWIEIRGGELSPQWVLRQRVLGAFPVQDASIDHQDESQNIFNMQQPYPNGESISLPMAMISRAFLSTFPGTWRGHVMLLIILFWPVCTVIARLAKEQLEMFGLNVAFPAIVTDCGANMRKAFNNTLQWDWLRCGCHLIHNVVTAGFTTLRNNAHNPAQTEAKKCQQALDR